MEYYFYNTDVGHLTQEPRSRYRLLIDYGFAALGGEREHFGLQFAQLAKHDLLLMYENRVGVVAVGRVLQQWDGRSHTTYRYYKLDEVEPGGAEYLLQVDWFLDLSSSPVTQPELPYVPRGAITRIVNWRKGAESMIEQRLSRLALPEEIPLPAQFVEGASRQISVNAYERNHSARQKCIEHYGPTCFICGFNFGRAYGTHAEGYIHVHHLRPLSEIEQSYIVDPIRDLRPVCPNCHAALHLGGSCRDIEEVRQSLNSRVL